MLAVEPAFGIESGLAAGGRAGDGLAIGYMKYVKQFMIIICICFVGEFIKQILPFPIPASIYGLLILLTLFCLKVVKVSQVKEVSILLRDRKSVV